MAVSADTDTPTVTLSFANNFWGKDDAGVTPLLERMHHAKTTCDELKAFYNARAAIEEDYARKLLALTKKPLGNGESGTLRMSLDTIKREVESMAKAHASVATQMKMELDDQLGVNAGGLKERRKVIQTGIEKLYKIKQQQTVTLNKARDRYEQDCLKAKNYTAQGHMVMGQEERRNKAKLEKTYTQMAVTSSEYQQAVTVLQETTGRWNREWKSACDKFQDLEEERIDYLKSSLWNFANISSAVCVTDDQACENVRLSLEKCDVEEDIISFIKVHGTGQDIPDPPKFIDFCRDDASDAASDIADTRPAQFPRVIKPAMRSGAVSPQPSMFESHHDPDSALAHQLSMNTSPGHTTNSHDLGSNQHQPQPKPASSGPYRQPRYANTWAGLNRPPVDTHDTGLEQFDRDEPPPLNASQISASSVSRRSRDSHSELSQASFTSYETSSASVSPVKSTSNDPGSKKTPWYRNSPFNRYKDAKDTTPTAANSPANGNPWASATAHRGSFDGTPTRAFTRGSAAHQESMSPEPLEPGVETQLNVGTNIFNVSTERRGRAAPPAEPPPLGDPSDPLEQALADLADMTNVDAHDLYGSRASVAPKPSRDRESADHHMGLYSPAPRTGHQQAHMPGPAPVGFSNATPRSGAPPAYTTAMVGHLGAPPAAHTAKEMQAAKNRYVNQRRSVFEGQQQGTLPQNISHGHHRNSSHAANSGLPARSVSPRPGPNSSHGSAPSHSQQGYNRPPSSQGLQHQQHPSSSQTYHRSSSPNPYAADTNPHRPRASTNSPSSRIYANHHPGSWSSQNGSSGMTMPRATSPASPGVIYGPGSHSRPGSRMTGSAVPADMSVQLHVGSGDYGGSMSSRPKSQYHEGGRTGTQQLSTRVRSKSLAEPRQYTKDGRIILHFARAMYMYQKQIPEELGFAKGDVLAVLRLQDDGWWEAEISGKPSERGLVPSNYLQAC